MCDIKHVSARPLANETDKGANEMVNYKVGDRIEQWCFGSPKHARIVTVTEKHADVKNGRAGFDGVMDDGFTVWGYDSDVHRVLGVQS